MTFMRWHAIPTYLLSLVPFVASTFAQDCEPTWSERAFCDVGMNYPIHRSILWDDGTGSALYVAGNFNIAGCAGIVNGVAKWNGTEWDRLEGTNGIGLASGTQCGQLECGIEIYDLVTFDDGHGDSLFVCGNITGAGGEPVNTIARWDGQEWHPLASTGDIILEAAFHLAVFDGGTGDDLYVAGSFRSQSQPGVWHSLCAWNGTEWILIVDTNGDELPGGVSGMEVSDDGSGSALYIGGSFLTIGDTTVSYITKWNGSTWSPLTGSSGTGVAGRPYTMCTYDDGNGPALYVAGSMLSAGGLSVDHIAKWDGSEWFPLSGPNGPGVGGYINDLSVFNDGTGERLYAAGQFSLAGGMPANNIASWNGSEWSPLPAQTTDGTNREIHTLNVFEDDSSSLLFAAGDFTRAGDSDAHFIASWDGQVWAPLWEPGGAGIDGDVRAFEYFDDGTGIALYVAGRFESTTAGQQLNAIAKWDGSQWTPLSGAFGTGVDDDIFAMTSFDDGSGPALYVGGSFINAGGMPARYIARWDGTEWSAVKSPAQIGFDNQVEALCVFDDGDGPTLFAGGYFQTEGSQVLNGIAKWDGERWHPLPGQRDIGMNSTVRALTVYNNGAGDQLYAAGSFTQAGGSTANRIARWNGTTWRPLLGTAYVGSSISALAVYEDGTGEHLYAGGPYTTIGSTTYNHIAKWTGSQWLPLNAQGITGVDGTVTHLQVLPIGSESLLFAGGSFTNAGSTTVNGAVFWNGTNWIPITGTQGTGFDSGGSPHAVVDDIFAPGDNLLIGGGFDVAGTIGSSGIARWNYCVQANCLPDTNNDGTLSPADFSAWVAAFNAMSDACDQNSDGSCTPADFSAWVANYNAGCN